MGSDRIDDVLDIGSVRQARRLLADTPDAMVALVDPEGTILWASRPGGSEGGREAASLVGANSYDFVHPDDRERLRRTYARAASGETVQCIYRARAPAGQWAMASTVAWGEPGESGPVVVTISSAHRPDDDGDAGTTTKPDDRG